MNKLTKVGCSALCGSLAVISAANAGDLTVTGGADLTYLSLGADTTGNPIGMGSNFNMKGSGELDNGWTVDVTTAFGNAGAFSAANISLGMGGLGKLNFNQGNSGNGIAAMDDKMPTAWEESWGAGLSTGVRLPLGSGASQNVMYTTPTVLGTTLTFTLAPSYGKADQGDKTAGDAGTADANSYDGTININPSLGTEILSGLNVFGGASSINSVQNNAGGTADRYQGVTGFTYDIGPFSIGHQWSGDYTGIDDGDDGSTAGNATNLYKAKAFGIAFNVNDDLSVSYGEWEHKKAGWGSSAANHGDLDEKQRTITVESAQVAYTMGGASVRIASIKVENGSWGTGAGDDRKATVVSLGLAF